MPAYALRHSVVALILVSSLAHAGERAVQSLTVSSEPTPNAFYHLDDTALGPDGSLYVAGTVGDGSGASALHAVRFGAAGQKLWEARFGQPSDNIRVEAARLDAAGRLWVVGAISALGSLDTDVLIVLLDTDGRIAWSARRDGGAHQPDYALAVATDGDAAVIAAYATPAAGEAQRFVLRYDALGREQWTATWSTTSEQGAAPSSFRNAVAVGPGGTAYVTGPAGITAYDRAGRLVFANAERSFGVAVVGDAIFTTAPQQTLRLAPDGRVVWRKPNLGGVVLAANARAVVAASTLFGDDPRDTDFETVAFDLDGNLRWERVYDSGRRDQLADLRLDDTGATYVVGESWSPRGLLRVLYPDTLLVKYDAAGNVLWTAKTADVQSAQTLELGNGALWTSGLDGNAAKWTQQQTQSCPWWQFWCNW